MIELYFMEWIMWQFDYKQHIIVNINTSDALHVITRKGKNNNYDWLSWHSAYVSQWDHGGMRSLHRCIIWLLTRSVWFSTWV
jgi:hypothetical protein